MGSAAVPGKGAMQYLQEMQYLPNVNKPDDNTNELIYGIPSIVSNRYEQNTGRENTVNRNNLLPMKISQESSRPSAVKCLMNIDRLTVHKT